MSTDIVPGSGQGILYAQQGPGTSPGYSALDERRSNGGAMQEGVYGTSTLVTAGGVANTPSADFMVTQRGAGANLSVDINMPAGGFAWVQGDTISGQGLYVVPVAAATINEALPTADPTNPTVHSIILEVLDNVLDASGSNKARTRVVPGTPTGGATLTNRTGAPALPGSALLLADVVVAPVGVSVANAAIRDRRKWARGAYIRITRTAGNYTTASASASEIDTTNLKPRVECAGGPVRVKLLGTTSHTTDQTNVVFEIFLDGSQAESSRFDGNISGGPGNRSGALADWDLLPAAGSHQISPAWLTGAATATLDAIAGNALGFIIEEIVRQNTANNTVTTG